MLKKNHKKNLIYQFIINYNLAKFILSTSPKFLKQSKIQKKEMHTEQSRTTQQYKQILRTYMLRMLALTQQSPKFAIMHPIDELDQYFSRFMHGWEIKQSTIYQLTNVEIKSDQQCLMVMTLLYDLAKWINDDVNMVIYNCNTNIQEDNQSISDKYSKEPNLLQKLSNSKIQPTTVQCIINQSFNILKLDKKHQTLQLKHYQLIRILLQMIPLYVPIVVAKTLYKEQERQKNKQVNQSANSNNYVINLFQFYVKLYDMLKEGKDNFTPLVRQETRKNYNKGIEETMKSITSIILFTNIQTVINFRPQKKTCKLDTKTQILMQTLGQMMKYISHIHQKSCQDLYKLCIIFNTVYMNASGANLPNGGMLSNELALPQNVIISVFPQVILLYGGNYSQIILSRIKIIKSVIQILTLLTNIKLTRYFSSVKSELPTEISSLIRIMVYNEQILHKSAHILIKINGYVRLTNYYVFGIIFALYQKIMKLLLKRQTMVPLYMYTHFVMNNLRLAMQWNSQKQGVLKPKQASNNTGKNLILIPQLNLHPQSYLNSLQQTYTQTPQTRYSQLIALQTILSQISNLFLDSEQLQYFLKLYDWNFMEQDICLNSIKYLYEFIEDSDNEKRAQNELFKKCLSTINRGIEQFLNDTSIQQTEKKRTSFPGQQKQVKKDIQQTKFKPYTINGPKKQRKQFYQLKKKQYLNIVQKINTKPKQIFKAIKQFNKNANIDEKPVNQTDNNDNDLSTPINNQVQLQVKSEYIEKCVRILKKSNHIQQKSMIDFVASHAPEANQILQKYIQNLIGNRSTNSLSKQNDKINRSINSDVEHFLRYMISNFFLSGEAQQIIRFIDKITQQYFKNQPAQNFIFKHSDSVYTFANAIILLNADQHNPKNPKKMSVEDFMKMCQNINCGESLPADIVRDTFKSIKQSEIYTFRNRYNMQKISLQCWLDIVNDYQSVGIDYYDSQMAQVCNENLKINSGNSINLGFKQYANQLLLSVIDEKETQKLQVMVQRFQYDDRKFDCQIIEKIRVMIVNKKHIAMHVLQKIFQQADFPHQKIDQKMISYCWLASGIIENFFDALPYSKIAEYLLKSWKVSFELKDNLFIRQNIQLKTIKKYIKQCKKKQTKKSIINMFSKFLSAKDSQNEENQELQSPKLNSSMSGSANSLRRRANITNSSFSILKSLLRSKQSRTRAAQAVLISLRHQQSRRFEQFVGCLYLIFHFVYGQKINQQIDEKVSKPQINQQCIDLLINLLRDFYCITEQHKIGARIDSLKAKNIQKYELVYTYTQFWTLKILFTWSIENYKISIIKKTQNTEGSTPLINIFEKLRQIYEKCLSLLVKINSDLLVQLTNILDVQGVTCRKLINEAKIPQQIILQLCNAVKICGINTKYVIFDKKQIQIPINVQQAVKVERVERVERVEVVEKVEKEKQNQEQIQTYMKELTQRADKQQQIQKFKEKENKQQEKQEKNISKEQQAKLQQDIEEEIKQQLGLVDEKSEQKNERTAKTEQNIKNQVKKEQKQNNQEQEVSNVNNEQLALPIYML